ncbi:DUF298-domain-containing protein [Fomitiporia mediterranea MF3/22]|uniref:DUF298-domain-containing protein n=1 Tax=Fomitiporia mediterranea (strain MF3/22) TaxID=694068 RepID=UPI0004408F03|nr:DUF298-domain-containing protein [Fomitiporia mediterranea MF3/22]EJD04875.1 DUF298-domain-containing protein [Fomitiporia mediterranea MF3/22]
MRRSPEVGVASIPLFVWESFEGLLEFADGLLLFDAHIVEVIQVKDIRRSALPFDECYAVLQSLEGAINAYYNDPNEFGGGSSKRAEAERTTRLNSLFDKYKGPTSPLFILDLAVNPEDVVLLAIAYELKAPSMGRWTRSGWLDGWRSLGQDTIGGMQTSLAALSQKLASDSRYFQQVYKYTFDFARSEGQRSLAIEDAQGFWSLLIPHGLSGGALRHVAAEDEEDEVMATDEEGWRPEYTEWWFEFLQEKAVKGISKDTWSMFLDFIQAIDSKFEKYDETAAWPSTIDDFVGWAREKRAATAIE